jgi:replication factor C subunit 3/5
LLAGGSTVSIVSLITVVASDIAVIFYRFFKMLWVDKHRPSSIDGLSYHDDVSNRLHSLAQNPASLPHLFFYGPSGAGKRTRITALLGALFGPSANRLKLDQRTFQTPTGRTVELHMVTSPHHVELSPGDAGNNDRYVIQDVLKELASTKNIRSSVANMDKENEQKNASSEIKIVVLNQVDRLSKQAQAALRRTMEKYASTCRLILCCDSPSKLIAPLRSRCLGIRVAAPTIDEVRNASWNSCRKELFFSDHILSFPKTINEINIDHHGFEICRTQREYYPP